MSQKSNNLNTSKNTNDGEGAPGELTISRISPHGQLRKTRARIANKRKKAHLILRNAKKREIKVRKNRERKQKKVVNQLYDKIRKEHAFSSTKRAAIDMNWGHITERISNANELHREISQQKIRCEEVTRKKNQVLDELEGKLTEKDDEYVVQLQRQEMEVNEIHEQMDKKIKNLREKFLQEIRSVERTYELRRRELLSKQEEKFDNKLKDRNKNEKEHLIERMKLFEEKEDIANEERKELQEKFSDTKKRMDSRVHSLEEDLDNVRYLFEFNTAKVRDYVEYLKRINAEKQKQVANNKGTLQRLMEQTHDVKERYRVDEQELENLNSHATKQLARFTRQYNNMLKKYKKFVTISGKKYKAVWKMNDENCRTLSSNLKNMDQFISEKILLQNWISNECPIPSIDERNKCMSPKISDTNYSSTYKLSAAESKPSKKTKNKRKKNQKKSIEEENEEEEEEEGESGDEDYEQKNKEEEKEKERRMEMFFERHVLTGLANSSTFLAEEKIKKILKNMKEKVNISKNEKDFLRAKSILKSLGIVKESDLQDFLEFCAIQVKMEGGAVNLNSNEILEKYLPSERIIQILKEYVKHRRKKLREETNRKLNSPNGVNKGKNKSSKYLIMKKNQAVKKEQIHDYWKRMENVVVPSKLKIWEHLKERVMEYHKDLQRRINLVGMNSKLRDQNNELMMLLHQQKREKINEELYIPPVIDL